MKFGYFALALCLIASASRAEESSTGLDGATATTLTACDGEWHGDICCGTDIQRCEPRTNAALTSISSSGTYICSKDGPGFSPDTICTGSGLPSGSSGLASPTPILVEGPTSLPLSTGTALAVDTPSSLDYVKAAAIIRWQALHEQGGQRIALEGLAHLADTCAKQLDTPTSPEPRITVVCDGR